MKDCKGTELMLGDHVVYVHGKNADAHLETGVVTKFYKGPFGGDECSVDSATHIRSIRVMKLGDCVPPKKTTNA